MKVKIAFIRRLIYISDLMHKSMTKKFNNLNKS